MGHFTVGQIEKMGLYFFIIRNYNHKEIILNILSMTKGRIKTEGYYYDKGDQDKDYEKYI